MRSTCPPSPAQHKPNVPITSSAAATSKHMKVPIIQLTDIIDGGATRAEAIDPVVDPVDPVDPVADPVADPVDPVDPVNPIFYFLFIF